MECCSCLTNRIQSHINVKAAVTILVEYKWECFVKDKASSSAGPAADPESHKVLWRDLHIFGNDDLGCSSRMA